jgi:hypothetical protein
MQQNLYALIDSVFGTQLNDKNQLSISIYPDLESIFVSTEEGICSVSRNLSSPDTAPTFRVRQTIRNKNSRLTIVDDRCASPAGSQNDMASLLIMMGSPTPIRK